MFASFTYFNADLVRFSFQDIIDELSKLRDSVEPFDTDTAKIIFKNETGLDIDDYIYFFAIFKHLFKFNSIHSFKIIV